MTLRALHQLRLLQEHYPTPNGVRFFLDAIMVWHFYGVEVDQMNYTSNRERKLLPCTQAVLDLERSGLSVREIGRRVLMEHVVAKRELECMLEQGCYQEIIDNYQVGYVTHEENKALNAQAQLGHRNEARYTEAGIVLLRR